MLNVHDMNLLGKHNYENVCAAIAMTKAAGIPDDICETIPSLPTRNSQHYPFVGKRSWYLPGYRYCVLHGIGYRQDAPYRTDGSFYRFAVLRIGHLSLLYKEEGKIK